MTTTTDKTKYRAVRWGLCSEHAEPAGPWHHDHADALRDVYARFAPYERATYEIERSDGARADLTDEEHNAARNAYHNAIAARDARGVWG